MADRISGLRAVAERYTAAWCSQAPARVAECYAPAGSLAINDGTPSVGRQAITETVQSFMTAFPDLRVTLDDVSVEGDGARYCWTLAGTNTGPGGNGNSVHISGFERWEIGKDDLIESSRGYFDEAEYLRQLG